MNKKASALDLIFILITLLTFAVTILLVFKIYDEINTEIQDSNVISDLNGSTEARQASTRVLRTFPVTLDNSFLFMMIGMSIAAFILAALVRIHPIFFVFYIILLAMIIFFSAIFANIYNEMASQTDLVAVANQLTFTSHIMSYLPFIVGIIGTLLAIVMYKNYQAAQL